jgi:hypothetical protein
VPATATASPDGTPNVSYISEVHYVDPNVAQFFSKTRQNVLENPRATLVVIHPDTGAQYRLAARYLRTEESGPLFECMKAKLAGIAPTGMSGCSACAARTLSRPRRRAGVGPAPVPAARRNYRQRRRNCAVHLAAATDLAQLLDCCPDGPGRESASTTRWC